MKNTQRNISIAMNTMQVLNVLGSFIITMYNTYQVLDTIKTNYIASRKEKSRKIGFTK